MLICTSLNKYIGIGLHYICIPTLGAVEIECGDIGNLLTKGYVNEAG